MKHVLAVAALVSLSIVGAPAPAAPFTRALDVFSADLAATADVLDPPADRAAKKQLAAIRAVQKTIEKRRSASLADDVCSFRDAVRRLGGALGQDAALLADGLVSVRAAVTADSADARADAETAFEGIVSRQVIDLLADSAAWVEDSLDDLGGDRPAWRQAESLRRAALATAAARRETLRSSRCTTKSYGRMVATVGTTEVRLPSAFAARVTDLGTGQFVSLELSTWIRRKGADPFRDGRLDVVLYAPAFQGAGSYDLGRDEALVQWRSQGDVWVSESGTVEVTAYDEARRTIAGTFSGTIRNLETSLPLTITGGRFAFCTWDGTTVSAAAK